MTLICLLDGCAYIAGVEDDVTEITIVDNGPFTVVAEIAEEANAEGTRFIKKITIEHQDKLQIASVQGVLFYDTDQSGSLDREKDGIILTFDDSTEQLSKELSLSPGFVHSGPGIGPLRLDGKVEVADESGERKWMPLSFDLSRIF